MNRLVEIRIYKLHPDTGKHFHDLVLIHSIPLLNAVAMEVVAHGPSLHDPDCYYLMRAFDDAAHLKASEDRFYSSAAWRDGPREKILALIESYWDAVLWLSTEAVAEMKKSHESLAQNNSQADPTAML